MRPIVPAALLVALSFAGCIGGGFSEGSSTDAFGNIYQVFDSQGDVPEDGATVTGASARDLLTKADAMAAEWSAEANLFTVATLEVTEEAGSGTAIYAGPEPESYEMYDAQPGDGLAPYWNFLYLSPEKVSEDACEYLFVHVVHNGFAVAYTFDPRDADFRGDDRAEAWLCDEHAPVGSSVRWTVDSDEASATLSAEDARFDPAASDADGALWALSLHPDADPEDQLNFDTIWLVSIIPELGPGSSPADFLTCMTAASSAAFDTTCFDASGDTGDDPDDGDSTPEPLPHASGSGSIEFGLVFTTSREDPFDIVNGSHPELILDVSISTDQVIPNEYTVALVDPSDVVQDSFTKQSGEGAEETLQAIEPVNGEWSLRITSEGGIPAATFDWCALGYDYVNETAVDCPDS